MTDSSITVDSQVVVARSFAKAAQQYDEYAEVYRQIGQRMLGRLMLLAIRPVVVLDLGCGTGQQLPALRKHYPKARVIGLDLVPAMLKQAKRKAGLWRKASLLAADAASLPLQDQSIDLVLSNMLLPWCQQPHRVFTEINRVLKPGGAVLFTTAGPDTLREYRAWWNQHNFDDPAFGLTDMHDLGDSLLACGFAAPVLDRENLTVSYPSRMALEQELRHTGTVNVALNRRRGLMNLSSLAKAQSAHGSPASGSGGSRFQITIELVQGHAWKGQPRDNEHKISMSALRDSLRSRGKADF